MRTQSIMLFACLVLVLAVATPSLADRPVAQEPTFNLINDDPVYHPIPLPVELCLPVYQPYRPVVEVPNYSDPVELSLPGYQPYRPVIMVPNYSDPVMDEDLYHLMVRPVSESCCRKMAR